MTSRNNPPYAWRSGKARGQRAHGYGDQDTERPPPVPSKVELKSSYSAAVQPPRVNSLEAPSLGATFVPGGFDDYFMPEVIAPSPQRVMPEVPHNMQKDLQRLEFEATDRPQQGDTSVSLQTNAANPKIVDSKYKAYTREGGGESGLCLPPIPSGKLDFSMSAMDTPSFSPFPHVVGDNIPLSDEQKEEVLYSARPSVLHSNNVVMQISWARDVLIWVEIAAEARTRDKKGKDPAQRPSTPKVEHELRLDAVNIVEYLAQQNHPEATFMKAKWQEFGKFGCRENKRDAYMGYKKAADMGWGRAEYRMGMLYENSNDTEKAIKHYSRGAEMGDSAANYRLGMMFLMGQHGYPKDIPRGLAMIQIAAESADEDAPQGAYVYGMLISRELPDIDIPDHLLTTELSLARQYIEKAAYLGFAKAQLKMGQAYELSQMNCDFKPALSLHYYGLAARQGQPEASLGVSRWFLFGFEGAFSKNEQLAYKYAEEAAAAGLGTGEFAMGYYYEVGIHVQKDTRQARKWYELAAEHGNGDARDRLDSLSQSKSLTKQDHETTTLTRIKSQHGSQRGKRPARFSRQNETMPTLSESSAPANKASAAARGFSPHVSPQLVPRGTPVIVEDGVAFPDPSHHVGPRQPAFSAGMGNGLAMRPKSAAPYPVDDRPAPLDLSRSRSTAPYPEDDIVRGSPLSPRFNNASSHPNSRPSSRPGPQNDRSTNAFGIRPPSSHSPNGPPTPDHRSRVQAGYPGGPGRDSHAPAGYGQPSPVSGYNDYAYGQGGPQQPYPHNQPLPPQRMGAASAGPGPSASSGTGPGGEANRSRLQNPNPNLRSQQPQGPPPGQYPGSSQGAQPGRDYGPRLSSRPVGDGHERYSSNAAPAGTGRVMPPARVESMSPTSDFNPNKVPLAGRQPTQDRIGQYDGRASAPPSQMARPPSANTSHSAESAPPSTKPAAGRPAATTVVHPDGKTIGNGPATFEEMGIPQGKNDGDCVVM